MAGDSSLELEQRLSGDLASLGDFARELSRLGSDPEDESDLLATPGDPGWESGSERSTPGRINADPATVEQSLAKLVLSLIELLRRLMEKQALRRIEAGSLTEEEIERMGETFLRLEHKMAELKETFGLRDEDLELNLGPLRELITEP